jgi:predicted ABC-type ATPase
MGEAIQPTIYILAGPNGAEKTTFAHSFLPNFANCREFLNADLIAAGLAPFSPETQTVRASELLLKRIDELVRSRPEQSFFPVHSRRFNRLRVRWRLFPSGSHRGD